MLKLVVCTKAMQYTSLIELITQPNLEFYRFDGQDFFMVGIEIWRGINTKTQGLLVQ